MPDYEFQCVDNDHQFLVNCSMGDEKSRDPNVLACPECQGEVRRVFETSFFVESVPKNTQYEQVFQNLPNGRTETAPLGTSKGNRIASDLKRQKKRAAELDARRAEAKKGT